jgi:hypothetical protein
MIRRAFLTSLAAVPATLAVPVLAQQQPLVRPVPTGRDPMLEGIQADVLELVREAKASPSARKPSLRAIESLLNVQAAHVGRSYDAQIKKAVQSAIKRHGGKDNLAGHLLQIAPASARTITFTQCREALDLLESTPLSALTRKAALDLRKVREKAPDLALAGYRPVIYMNCSDLRRAIEHFQWLGSIIGMSALVEPGPFFEAGLLAVGTIIAGYKLAEFMAC